ncbi:hypothetical protein ARMGADRAFT_631019 [Armillaria gallica]|uniref:Uncharacterized protein n=1 Tax=Armillaria gallica TaxID=47427 RepID=A0A2H3DPW5_ARMGA|nr:hypothetical protein ARMGADRAFT_631019 [Armillaria gallica]
MILKPQVSVHYTLRVAIALKPEFLAVGARPPILAYTQSNSSHQGPSGWPATNNDNNVNHPPTSLNKYTFPSKPADALEASSGSYRKSRRNEAPVRPQTSMGSKPKKADRHRPGNLTDSEAPLKMTLQLKTEIRATSKTGTHPVTVASG